MKLLPLVSSVDGSVGMYSSSSSSSEKFLSLSKMVSRFSSVIDDGGICLGGYEY